MNLLQFLPPTASKPPTDCGLQTAGSRASLPRPGSGSWNMMAPPSASEPQASTCPGGRSRYIKHNKEKKKNTHTKKFSLKKGIEDGHDDFRYLKDCDVEDLTIIFYLYIRSRNNK